MENLLTSLLWVSSSGSASDFDDVKVLAEQGDADAKANIEKV